MRKRTLGRRFFSAAVAACLSLGALTACGGSGENATTAGAASDGETTAKASDDGEITIRVCWWGNQTRNDGTVKALDLYTAEHPNVKFEVEFSDWSGYWDKLSTQAAGGNLPDIIQMDYSYISQYAKKGQIIGMNQFIEDKTIDTTNIPDTIIDSGKVDGEVYGISTGTNAKALLVNEDVLAEVGATLPEQPTWEEFFDVAQKVYDKTGMQIEIPSNDEQSMLFLARPKGLTMFNEAGDALGMPDDTIALRYYKMLKDTLDAGYHISPEAMAEASTNQQSLFAAGKEWCQLTNSNMITNTINQCEEGLNYKIYMYPTEADAVQQPIFLKPSSFWSITKDSKNAAAAADVIDFLTNSVEANEQGLKAERGVPVSTVVSEAIAPAVDEATARINEYVTKVGEVATPIDPPFPPASAEIGKHISDLADAVRYGEMTPEDAAKDFYETATALLEKGAQQ